MTMRAKASTQARLTQVDRPMMRPPMPMMGAKHSSRRPILRKFCTWVMSLVERVMRVAPEKRSISSLLK